MAARRKLKLTSQAQANIDRFREWLAQHIAHTGWRDSMEHLPPESLAPFLGVEAAILQRALEIRIGEPVPAEVMSCKLRAHVGGLGMAAVERGASRYGTTPGLLFLTVAHFAMASDFEPKAAPPRRFMLPNLGSVSISDGRGSDAQHGRVLYQVSGALGQALSMRSKRWNGKGCNRNAYVRGIMSAWLAGQFHVPRMLWSWEEAYHDLSRYQTEKPP